MVVVLAVAVLGVLAWRYAGDTTAGGVDRAARRVLTMRREEVATLGDGFADLGDPGPVALTLVVLAIAARALRGGRGLALVLVGPLLAMVTTSVVLKPLIGRMHEGGLALPSGHTTAVASLALTAGLVLLGPRAVTTRGRWLWGLALAGLVGAVAVSLVGRGYHYATDTVGGFCVALAVVLTTALVVDLVADRRRVGRGRRD